MRPGRAGREASPERRRGMAAVSRRVGAGLVVVSLGAALVGPLVAPEDPLAIVGPPRSSPGSGHLLGTDQLGRDLLSRVLSGGLDVVVVPTVATLLAFAVGAAVGMVSGYVGGAADRVTTRAVDVLIALPPLLLAIVAIAAFGSSTMVLVAVTAIFFIPRIVRVIRGATASVAATDYVAASRARGDGVATIVRRDVAPNLAGELVTELAARLSNVVLFLATLSFLGLGTRPPQPSWGLLVAENTLLLRSNPLAPLAPALLIAALVVGVNLLADTVTDGLTRRGSAL